MPKVCLLISLAIAASGAVAAPSASVLVGPDSLLPPAQKPCGIVGSITIPPEVPHARACFKRSAVEELIRSSDGLSTAVMQTLLPPLGGTSLGRSNFCSRVCNPACNKSFSSQTTIVQQTKQADEVSDACRCIDVAKDRHPTPISNASQARDEPRRASQGAPSPPLPPF